MHVLNTLKYSTFNLVLVLKFVWNSMANLYKNHCYESNHFNCF